VTPTCGPGQLVQGQAASTPHTILGTVRFFLALLIVALAGRGLWKIIAVLAVLGWPLTARLVRAEFLSLREQESVEAAPRARHERVAGRHLHRRARLQSRRRRLERCVESASPPAHLTGGERGAAEAGSCILESSSWKRRTGWSPRWLSSRVLARGWPSVLSFAPRAA
jgi:hypothetical protein